MKIPSTKTKSLAQTELKLTVLIPFTRILEMNDAKPTKVAPGRAQTNPNDPNSKTKTKDPSIIPPNSIVPGSP